MRDDLLARADRAIRESQFVRDTAHKDRVSARIATERARATIEAARAEHERSVTCRDMAIQALASSQEQTKRGVRLRIDL